MRSDREENTPRIATETETRQLLKKIRNAFVHSGKNTLALFSEKNTLYLSLLLAKTNIAKIVTVAFLAMCAIEECKLAQRNVLLGDL